jgi:4-hydroxybenzoate polyprenyltransferase
LSISAGQNTVSPKTGALQKVAVYLEMIKIEHSVFALPFAYFGAFAAVRGVPAWQDLLLITIAMVGARSLAMALNRIIDAGVDALNPRTRERAIPKGLLSVPNVVVFALVSLAVFMLAVFNLNPICRLLWPLVVVPFVIYPYTKRVTWTCHFVLGACLGLAPVGAWTAITGDISGWSFVIGLGVMLWTAGFDVIYACQDVGFDRDTGLKSIPVRFGVARALVLTKILHAASIVIFCIVGLGLGFGAVYYFGVFLAAALLAYENSLVKVDDLTKLGTAFFTMNGVISIVLFTTTAADILLRGRW